MRSKKFEGELINAKVTLYRLFLKMGQEDWDGTELETAYQLSQDKQIQNVLNRHTKS